MIFSRIAGTGRSVPEKILTNADLAKIVDTSDEWIVTRTGIRERHIVAEDQTTSDLAAAAGKNALEAAGVAVADLDCIIIATVTPDTYMPACAVYVQQKLGATCPAFDISAACAGFSYGMTIADGLIRSGIYKRVLFVGAESLTRVTNWEDRTTCILFGDGAGAVVMVAEDHDCDRTSPDARGVLSSKLAADGSLAPELLIKSGGSARPPSHETVDANEHTIAMNGRAIFSNAVRGMSDAAADVLTQVGLSTSDVDFVIPHQANMRIIEAVAKRLELPPEKVLVNIERYGNTSSASIPIALDEAVRDGRIREGMNIVLTGLGGGLAWGAVLVRW